MGFANIATTIIMFIAVLLLATGVLITLQTNIDKSQASMQAQAELLNNEIITNMDITSANYTVGNVRVYAVNNGKSILKLDRIDCYIDEVFIPRNDTNRTIQVEVSTDTKNPGLWDPNEIIRIDISTTLDVGTHTVKLTTQYGNREEEIFSI